jgi:hypothetical protein
VTDIPSTVQALRAYGLRLDNGDVVSFGDLVDALEKPVRNDAAEPPSDETTGAAAMPPITNDTEEDLNKVGTGFAELAQKLEAAQEQLAEVEAEDRMRAVEDKVAQCDARSAQLEARTEAIQAALAKDDVGALAQLMGDDLEVE